MNQKTVVHLSLMALSAFSAVAEAGTVIQPDAGRTLQELAPAPVLPKPSVDLNVNAPAITEGVAGGASTVVQSITIKGNTIYDQSTLLTVIGEVSGKSFDLAGLKDLANLVTEHYRKNGYPFARAFVPAQSMSNGAVLIEVVEGRYGEVKANGDDKRVSGAQKFIDRLRTGDVIESKKLERVTLILSDQPGYKSTPIISPGQQVGTGDLDVSVARDSRFTGEIGLDNSGNRYTGRTRGRVDLYANSPFLFGDQLHLSTLYTEENLWYGSLNYGFPIGGSGLRGNLGYSHTYYELGKEFSALKANGTAKVTSAGLSYPIIRTQNANLTLSGTYQHKKLNDRNDSVDTSFNKFSNSLPVTLNFDVRDQFVGGGVTYGSVSWTHGKLNLDNILANQDKLTARTEGSVDKINVDVTRFQSLPAKFSFLGRLSLQQSMGNLDSSEKFGLGGVNGVRAFPSGEGFGDDGVLARLELRYTVNNFTPYVFYDAGTVKTNHNSFDNSKNYRSISGAGLGVRVDTMHWGADASVAWRASGGNPLSDVKVETPMLWVSAKYKF